jgi:hypothetical protein
MMVAPPRRGVAVEGCVLGRRSFPALFLAFALLSGPGSSAARAGGPDLDDVLRFAADVAQKGDWREARYRWEQAAKIDPGNPRILNNLAVAEEILGNGDKARQLYDRAVSLAGGDPRIEDNAARAAFFRRTSGAADAEKAAESRPAPEDGPQRHRGRRGAIRVQVKLPLPARLDLSKEESLLVAGFLSNESALLDAGREIVRFLRTEFHKHTALKIRDVTPPPAVPEQTVEDLVANAEFWKHLGREYDADLVVSGVVRYGRRDASGFGDVDMVSPVTGQKVRQTQFIEQERFTFELQVFFFDGATGSLLFRDQLQRSAVYRGLANDPITAFYELGETIAGDVLAVVAPRNRDDTRMIFRD